MSVGYATGVLAPKFPYPNTVAPEPVKSPAGKVADVLRSSGLDISSPSPGSSQSFA